MAQHPMAGAASNALSSVKIGLEALQKALTQVPMGSDLHTALLKAIGDVAKHVGDAEADHGSTMQSLANMAKSKAQAPNQQALAKLMGQPGGAGGGPPPPMPPGGGGGAPPPPLEA
jgi:hypothetical protein